MVVNEALPDSTISEMLATVNGIPATPSKIKPIVVSGLLDKLCNSSLYNSSLYMICFEYWLINRSMAFLFP